MHPPAEVHHPQLPRSPAPRSLPSKAHRAKVRPHNRTRHTATHTTTHARTHTFGCTGPPQGDRVWVRQVGAGMPAVCEAMRNHERRHVTAAIYFRLVLRLICGRGLTPQRRVHDHGGSSGDCSALDSDITHSQCIARADRTPDGDAAGWDGGDKRKLGRDVEASWKPRKQAKAPNIRGHNHTYSHTPQPAMVSTTDMMAKPTPGFTYMTHAAWQYRHPCQLQQHCTPLPRPPRHTAGPDPPQDHAVVA